MNGPMNSRQKLWFSKSFAISILFLDLNVYVKPHWPKFSYFFVSKNKNANNKNFFKKLLHIQKTKIKNFCDTLLLIYGTRCGIIFHILTIILEMHTQPILMNRI